MSKFRDLKQRIKENCNEINVKRPDFRPRFGINYSLILDESLYIFYFDLNVGSTGKDQGMGDPICSSQMPELPTGAFLEYRSLGPNRKIDTQKICILKASQLIWICSPN